MNEGVGVGVVFGEEATNFFLFPYGIKKYQPVLLSEKPAEIFCENYLNNIQEHDGCEFEIKSDQI